MNSPQDKFEKPSVRSFPRALMLGILGVLEIDVNGARVFMEMALEKMRETRSGLNMVIMDSPLIGGVHTPIGTGDITTMMIPMDLPEEEGGESLQGDISSRTIIN